MRQTSLGAVVLLTLTASIAEAACTANETPAPSSEVSQTGQATSAGKTGLNVTVEPGYSMTPVATGFDFPTGIAFDRHLVYVAEAGAIADLPPRIKVVDEQRRVTTLLSSTDLPHDALAGPLTSIIFHDGALWLFHRQTGPHGWQVGAVSRFDPANPVGTFKTVLTNLPCGGDSHYSEGLAFDRAGRGYVAIGSATNTGVVGRDNRWLHQSPGFHDFAPVDIVLAASAYRSVERSTRREATTAPFMPYNSGAVATGTVVRGTRPDAAPEGIIAANGSIYSFDPADARQSLRLEAWGLRNPSAIGFDRDDDGRLFATSNGAAIRAHRVNGALLVSESRPIANDSDDMFVIDVKQTDPPFFGFPDYVHDAVTRKALPVEDPSFCASTEPPIACPRFVLDETFRGTLDPQDAFAQLEHHSAAGKFDFAPGRFGAGGDIFVAESGGFLADGNPNFAGYKVVRVDRTSGEVKDFIVNSGTTTEERFDRDGFNRPIDVKFRHSRMYVLDFGAFEPGITTEPGTGKLWLVTPRNRTITTSVH